MFSGIQTPRSGHPRTMSLDDLIWESGYLKTPVFIFSSKLTYFFNCCYIILYVLYVLPKQNQQQCLKNMKNLKSAYNFMFWRPNLQESINNARPQARRFSEIFDKEYTQSHLWISWSTFLIFRKHLIRNIIISPLWIPWSTPLLKFVRNIEQEI